MAPDRRLLSVAAVFGFFGVALGAFGAHLLRLQGEAADWWHTATLYHLVHAVAALFAGTAGAPRSGWLFLAGTVVFAGSLYALALTNVRLLGAITPLGGILFLTGWAMLAIRLAQPEKD